MKKRFVSLMLALCIILSMATVSAVAEGVADAYPYGKAMSSDSVTLVIDVAGSTYLWQRASEKNGAYVDISDATSATLTLSSPASGTWYRCVVDGTASKAVQVIKPVTSDSGDANGRIWTDAHYDHDSNGNSYYITNGTVAYCVNGSGFDVTGFYKVESGDYAGDYMMQTSYSEWWSMYSSTEANPSAVGFKSGTSAKLDDLRVSFSESNKYAVIFEADLASTESSFSFGCDTQLGNSSTSGSYSDYAALAADVTGDGGLNKISMVGSADSEDKNAPAFIIAPSVSTPASKFWIGHYYSRELYSYNTQEKPTNDDNCTTSVIQSSNVVTTVEKKDSGMTISWIGIEEGSTVGFTFSVGKLGDITGGVIDSPTGSVVVDYSEASLEGTVTGYEVYVDSVKLNEDQFEAVHDETTKEIQITFKKAAGLKSNSIVEVQLIVGSSEGSTTAPEQPAKFKIDNNIKYTVTVNVNDENFGTATASPTSAKAGAAITLTATPNAGYVFDKWEVTPDTVTIDENNSFIMPESDVTVKAVFKPAAYTVTFYAEDGITVLKSKEWAVGTTPYYDADPDTDGIQNPTKAATAEKTYTFAGWTPEIVAVSGNASYTATFTDTVNTYYVTFNANGGKGEMSKQGITYGETEGLKANTFTRMGYTFTGWNTAADGSGTAYEDGAEITLTEDVTLYAQWKKNPTIITITASSSINGGITPMGETVVKRGCDKTYYISAPKGYTVSKVLVDGVNVGAVTEYTFENVRSSHTIHVVFTKSKLTVKDFLYGDYQALTADILLG